MGGGESETGKKISELSVQDITSSSFYEQLVSLEEYKKPTSRGELEFQILERAKELGVKGHVAKQLKETEKNFVAEEKKKARGSPDQTIDGITNFFPDSTGKEYQNLACGSWLAGEGGIYSMESSRADQVACYHPILPVKRMRNEETGEEQITLAYKRGGINGLWQEVTVPKEMVANSRSITTLAKYGLNVTSESAKLLVRYLSTVECLNEDKINVVNSSSKLGWHGKEFLPYDNNIIFDADMRFRQIFKSIHMNGSFDAWMNCVKHIRKSKYIEPRIALAASFASVLIKSLNISCVLIDFNGATEAGKTIMLMLATSVWACPDEGLYMGDFLTTDAELEVRSDMLNNLPLILDDTSKMKKNIRDNIEQVIYNLSSGSGKKRSNKELGSERVRTWKNAVIINGERPLNSFVEQGGAINRILEIDVTGIKLFDDPSGTADLIRENYGFAGKMFVDAVKEMTDADIRKLHSKYCQLLKTDETMQKQVLSMAAILAADEIAEKTVFQDNRALTVDDVARYLTKRSQVEEGSRCYEYLMSFYAEKRRHFDPDQTDKCDQYGFTNYDNEKPPNEWINFNVNSFDEITKAGGFSRKAFTAWAKRVGLLRANKRDQHVVHLRNSDGKGTEKYYHYISFKIVNLEDYLVEKRMFE